MENAKVASNSSKNSGHEKTDSAAERVHEAVDRAAAMAGTSEERLKELADELRGHADKLAESARSRSKEVTAVVGDYTRENPIKSIGLAFLLGTILAYIFRK
ncbi:MAG: hypothetical protein P1U47_10050 [Zhongshania sp.]|uniref:DUF883 family protein n=1 Tax=Zhongshania sp. TaxID=1971902 RepID=UPI0026265F33|nr:hypothetical protein [Zhongshania sp.]MDF1692706.1 hypothetical protein [Zhongshania sp.]